MGWRRNEGWCLPVVSPAKQIRVEKAKLALGILLWLREHTADIDSQVLGVLPHLPDTPKELFIQSGGCMSSAPVMILA